MQPQTMLGSANTLRQSRMRHRTLTLLAFSIIRICQRVGCSSANLQKQQMKWVGLSLEPGKQASIEIQSGVMLFESSLTARMGLSLVLQNCDSSMFFWNFSEKCVLKKLVFHRSIYGKASSRLHPSSLLYSQGPFFSISRHFLHFFEGLGCIWQPLTDSTCGNLLSTDSAIELNFCSLVMPDSNRTCSVFCLCQLGRAQLRMIIIFIRAMLYIHSFITSIHRHPLYLCTVLPPCFSI